MVNAVIVNGALGKMGSLACDTIATHPDFKLVDRLTKGQSLSQAIAKTHATIVIDLTRADAVYANCLAIIEAGAHPVVGTSGLTDEQILDLSRRCEDKQLGGIIAPNFSIAVVLMMRFAAAAAHYFPDVELIEAHHAQKYDAPSGTAVKTAELIAQARSSHPKQQGHASVPGVLGGLVHGVAIHSIRLPGIVARQEVLFGNTGETLSIVHNSIDRASFMPGLIYCCEKVTRLDKLYYGLDQILDL